MKSAVRDARGFVEGVMDHLKRSGRATEVVPRVQTLLLKMTARAKRENQATVESVVKLTAGELSAVGRVLSRIAGHEISLVNAVNAQLIGGMRITMGDWVMDASVRSELSDMARIVAGS